MKIGSNICIALGCNKLLMKKKIYIAVIILLVLIIVVRNVNRRKAETTTTQQKTAIEYGVQDPPESTSLDEINSQLTDIQPDVTQPDVTTSETEQAPVDIYYKSDYIAYYGDRYDWDADENIKTKAVKPRCKMISVTESFVEQIEEQVVKNKSAVIGQNEVYAGIYDTEDRTKLLEAFVYENGSVRETYVLPIKIAARPVNDEEDAENIIHYLYYDYLSGVFYKDNTIDDKINQVVDQSISESTVNSAWADVHVKICDGQPLFITDGLSVGEMLDIAGCITYQKTADEGKVPSTEDTAVLTVKYHKDNKITESFLEATRNKIVRDLAIGQLTYFKDVAIEIRAVDE